MFISSFISYVFATGNFLRNGHHFKTPYLAPLTNLRLFNFFRDFCWKGDSLKNKAIHWTITTCVSGPENEETEEGGGWSSYVYRWTSFTWPPPSPPPPLLKKGKEKKTWKLDSRHGQKQIEVGSRSRIWRLKENCRVHFLQWRKAIYSIPWSQSEGWKAVGYWAVSFWFGATVIDARMRYLGKR